MCACVGVYLCVCSCELVCVVAVAQREQLYSTPHTSFVSELSWLANGAPPPPQAQTRARDHRRASGGFRGGTWSEFTVPACMEGEGLGSMGQGWLSDTN